ncbi:MAG TPA: rRNA maturation RNase YbeY [Longimicrobiales bacterium]|nr:rRNA maturation RNase YbeY [Longimicrobiales bacterium]
MQVAEPQGADRDPSPHLPLVRAAAAAALRAAGAGDAFLSVTLLDDAAIAELNAAHLGHEGATDVISFRFDGPDERVEGDVYVGHEAAARAAEEEGVAWEEELARLTVHGVLHVIGHDHAAGPERTSGAMWELQESVVAQVMRAVDGVDGGEAGP